MEIKVQLLVDEYSDTSILKWRGMGNGQGQVEGGESQWMNFADDGGQQVNMSEEVVAA